MHITVMGIGNLLCGDDGVGIHAIRSLEGRGLPAHLVDAGTAMLHALSFAEDSSHLVVIDAVEAGQRPGSVYCFDGYDMESRSEMHSLHSLGLRQALELDPAGRRPSHFVVLGVEPASIEYGTELSEPVRAALPAVVARAVAVVDAWTASDGGRE